MENNAIVVFGATGGIGSSIVTLLKAKEFQNIIGTYRNRHPERNDIIWMPYNIGNSEELNSLAILLENFKTVSIIYTIGTPSSKKNIVDTDFKEWYKLLEINCLSFVSLYVTLSSLFRKKKSRILVFSSDATRTISQQNGPYTASKAALEAAIVTLAKEEEKYGVRLNCIAPSLIDSPLANDILIRKGVVDKDQYLDKLPFKRAISLSEIAGIATSIVLDDYWNYVSGQIIRFTAN